MAITEFSNHQAPSPGASPVSGMPSHVDFVGTLFIIWGLLTALVGVSTLALGVGAVALIASAARGGGGQVAAGLTAVVFTALAIIAIVWGAAHVLSACRCAGGVLVAPARADARVRSTCCSPMRHRARLLHAVGAAQRRREEALRRVDGSLRRDRPFPSSSTVRTVQSGTGFSTASHDSVPSDDGLCVAAARRREPAAPADACRRGRQQLLISVNGAKRDRPADDGDREDDGHRHGQGDSAAAKSTGTNGRHGGVRSADISNLRADQRIRSLAE